MTIKVFNFPGNATPVFAPAFPGRVLSTDNVPGNTADTGAEPTLKYMGGEVLPYVARDGDKRQTRPLFEVQRDRGDSFENWRYMEKPFEEEAKAQAWIDNGNILRIDRPMISLANSLTRLSGKTIISQLGNEPVTLMLESTTKGFLDGSLKVFGLRMIGKFRFAYRDPAAATCKALDLTNFTDCFFDDIRIDDCGIGLYHAGISNTFNRLHIVNATGKAVRLLSGSDLTINHSLSIEGPADVGLSIESSWLGGLRCNVARIKGGQKEALVYAAAGTLDRIGELRASNNGLATTSPTTYDAITVASTARDFVVQTGEIGQDPQGSAVTQKYGVNVAAGADRIRIGASLIGNTTPFQNLATGDITLNGLMPAGTDVATPTNIVSYTPTVTFATPGDSSLASTTTLKGWYAKVGKLCYVDIAVDVTFNSFTTASGALIISLPFTSYTDTGSPQPNLNCGQTNTGINWATSFTQLQGRVINNTANCEIGMSKSAGSSGVVSATTNVAAGAHIILQLSGWYLTA